MKTNYLAEVKNIKKILFSNITIVMVISLLFTINDFVTNYISKYFLFLGAYIYIYIKLKYFKILNENIKLKIYSKYSKLTYKDFFLKDSLWALKQSLYIFMLVLFLLSALYFVIRLQSTILMFSYAIYIGLVILNMNTYYASLIKKEFKNISIKDVFRILNIFEIKIMILKENYFNTFMWIIIQFLYASLALLLFNLATYEIFTSVTYILNFIAYTFITINVFNDYIYYKSIN